MTNRQLKTKIKVDLLTGEQPNRNDITSGLRVTRHSLPTLTCFNIFSTLQDILKFFTFQQMLQMVLLNTEAYPSVKPNESFFVITLVTSIRLITVFWIINN